MKNFNLNRIGLLLKLDLMQNRKKYLQTLGGLLLGHLFLEFITYFKASRGGLFFEGFTADMLSGHLAGMMASYEMMFGYVIMLLCFSSLFNHLPDKVNRTYMLMLPATNHEKLLCRVLICLVLLPVCFLATMALGDGLRMLFFPLLGQGFDSMLPRFYSVLTDGLEFFCRGMFTTAAKVEFWALAGFQFCGLTFYALGGTIFRRRNFIYVSLLLIGFGLLMATLLGSLPDTMVAWMETTWGKVAGAVLFWGIAAFNLWYTWYRFKNMQVIPRKLFGK